MARMFLCYSTATKKHLAFCNRPICITITGVSNKLIDSLEISPYILATASLGIWGYSARRGHLGGCWQDPSRVPTALDIGYYELV